MSKWLQLARHLPKVVKQAQALAREFERGTGRTERRSQPRNRQVPSGVRIEYSPEMDGDADPGEVVWSWVPFEDDPNRGKDRPVVIVGRTGNDFAAVPLTSKKKGRADHVPVGTGGWDRRGRPSYAKVDRLLTIDADEVRREGAVLDRSRFDEVVHHLGRYHDLARR